MKAYEITETSGYKTIAYAKNRYWLFKKNKTERYKRIKSARCLTKKPYKSYLLTYDYQNDDTRQNYPSQREICARSEVEAKYILWECRGYWEHYFNVKATITKHYVVYNRCDYGIRKEIGHFVLAENKKSALEKYPDAYKIVEVKKRGLFQIAYRWLGTDETIVIHRRGWCEADAYDQYTIDTIDKYKDRKGIIVEYIRRES